MVFQGAWCLDVQKIQGESGAVICLGVPSWLTTTQGLVVVQYCWVSVCEGGTRCSGVWPGWYGRLFCLSLPWV